MIIRGVTPQNDWQFGKGLQDYFTGTPAIAANVKTKLLEWVGECFFDNLAGIDWRNLIGNYGQQTNLLIAVKSVALSCYGVVAVSSASFNFNGQTRAYVLTMTIQTIYSQSATVSVTAPTQVGT